MDPFSCFNFSLRLRVPPSSRSPKVSSGIFSLKRTRKFLKPKSRKWTKTCHRWKLPSTQFSCELNYFKIEHNFSAALTWSGLQKEWVIFLTLSRKFIFVNRQGVETDQACILWMTPSGYELTFRLMYGRNHRIALKIASDNRKVLPQFPRICRKRMWEFNDIYSLAKWRLCMPINILKHWGLDKE